MESLQNTENLASPWLSWLEHSPITEEFNSRLKHMPGLWVQSRGPDAYGRQLMDTSHIDVSVSLPLSKSNEKKSPQVRIKKNLAMEHVTVYLCYVCLCTSVPTSDLIDNCTSYFPQEFSLDNPGKPYLQPAGFLLEHLYNQVLKTLT